MTLPAVWRKKEMKKIRDLWFQGFLIVLRFAVIVIFMMPFTLGFQGLQYLLQKWDLRAGVCIVVLVAVALSILPVWLAVAVRAMRRLISTDEPFVSRS